MRQARHDFHRERANNTSVASSTGKAAGEDAHAVTMILASAMRHSVGRPATGMEGGIGLWSGFARRRLICLKRQRGNASHGETHFTAHT